jgi:hypothetical protein
VSHETTKFKSLSQTKKVVRAFTNKIMLKTPHYHIQAGKALFLLLTMLLLKSLNTFSQSNSTTNRVDTVWFSDFLSNSNKTDTVPINHKLDFFNFFKIIQCLSGTVYFTGNGFPGAMMLQCTESEARLKIGFERCVSGSKLTLENCKFFRDGGRSQLK